MSDNVITTSNLGKKYTISHHNTAGYPTLRETLTGMGTSFLLRLRNPSLSQSKLYKSEVFWALKNINLDIQQGDRIGIIGGNGAGKSTLLKVLSRITEPTTGKITIEGKIASLLEVGTGFHPELTGRENIFLNGAILGMSKVEIKTKFEEIVHFSEIEKFLDTPVKRYSSGMYVRLAFAVAAHLESDILIVDEVLAVGDAHFQKKCLGKMKEVGSKGRTILFVSHNMGAIRKLCDKCIFLKNGRIQDMGPPADVISSYLFSNGSDRRSLKNISDKYKSFYITEIKIQLEKISYTQNLTIHLSLDFLKDIKNIGFGIIIKTIDGVVVSNISPNLTGTSFDFKTGQKYLKISIENLQDKLPGGEYIIDFWIAKKGIEKLITLDNIHDFSIEGLDVYSSGQTFEYKKHGFVKILPSYEVH